MPVPAFEFIAVVICALVAVCSGAWVPYTSFNGYIPSYTYKMLNLNTGDVIRGLLSWPGSQDLDIYLYQDGMNLLSRSVYTDR